LFRFDDREEPALYNAEEGMRPFEMTGWTAPVLWSAPQNSPGRLLEFYGQGVVQVGLTDLDEKAKSWENRVIRWRKNGAEASMMMTASVGMLGGSGFSVRLRKIDGHWMVISLELEWVS
jgi:hypothetical protein